MSTLYLIPSLLSDDGLDYMPPNIKQVISTTMYYVVERERTARRFIKAIDRTFDLTDIQMIEMDKHNQYLPQQDLLHWLEKGVDIGLISEAGCPCIADPGAEYVDKAREFGYAIKPLSGPSSILMALMASGLNGQQFCFHGYLPIDPAALKGKLDQLANDIVRSGYTHIFIETPYRNAATLSRLKTTLPAKIRLCIAQDLCGKSENIKTLYIKDWQEDCFQEKVPAIFLIGK